MVAPIVAEVERLLDGLTRAIDALPPEIPRASETLWGACSLLAQARRYQDGLMLWSALRRGSDRHCPDPVSIGEAATTWLARGGGASDPTTRRAAVALAEALVAVANDLQAQDRVLAPLGVTRETLTRETFSVRSRAFDLLRSWEPLMPIHAREQIAAWRLEGAE